MKMWKVYDNANDDDNNDGQSTKFDQKSSLEPYIQAYNNKDNESIQN